MNGERYASRGEADDVDVDVRIGRREGRRDRRKWWAQAEAWDPERWKAMAAAWASMWEDGPGAAQAQPGTDEASKTCPFCAEEIKPAAIRCKCCETWLAPPPEPFAHVYDHPYSESYAPPHRLTRSTRDAMVYGVLSGLGRFFGIDPTWVRIVYALGSLFTGILPGIIVYAILAFIIPRDVPLKGPAVE
jgi:phage shock protein PspC (stress-responsive transcriptional regulator)